MLKILLLFWMSVMANATTSNHLNIILTTEEITDNPVKCKGYQQFQVINLFLDTLVHKDQTNSLNAGIASSWDVSSDGTEYTFHIDPKAIFHNGDQILAKDVEHSFQQHLTPNSTSFIGIYLKNVVQKIETLNDKTIKFTLRGAYPPFLNLISMSGYGIYSHKSKENEIIGSGPYKFTKKDPKNSCLERFKKYPYKQTKVEGYCFTVERDIDTTVDKLNSNQVDLAMGSPLEVALSPKLKNDIISSPTFSLVSTHVIINHHNKYLQNLNNRKIIRDVLYDIRKKENILTKFDQELNNFLPKGILPESYYVKPTLNPLKKKVAGQTLRIVFPYGIFLESSVLKIVEGFKKAGFKVTFKNVKGKELLEPILAGNYDLLFIPYQGTLSDIDGYLDLLNPKSVFSTANMDTKSALNSLEKIRFNKDKNKRAKQIEVVLQDFEKKLQLIPFCQNSIPIVHSAKLLIPNLNFTFHLNLREIDLR